MTRNPPRVVSSGWILSCSEEAHLRKPLTCSICGNHYTRASPGLFKSGFVESMSSLLEEPLSPTMSSGNQLALEIAPLHTFSATGSRYRAFNSENLGSIPRTNGKTLQARRLKRSRTRNTLFKRTLVSSSTCRQLVWAARTCFYARKGLYFNARSRVRRSEHEKIWVWQA